MGLDSRNDRQADRERPYWIKITGQASGTNAYAWEQVLDTDTAFPSFTGAFAMSGTSAATGWPAYEVNGRTDVPVGAKVLATVSASGKFWVFSYGPTLQLDWLSSLTELSCIKLTVVAAHGICSGVSLDQEFFLTFDADEGVWTSDPEVLEVETGESVVSFWLEGGTAHAQLDDFGYELFRVGGGGDYLLFAGDSLTLCNADEGEPEECQDNSFVVRLECSCCPIPNWGGDGWYCIVGSSQACGSATPTCVELLESENDHCNDEITICSGPYASQAACSAACTGAATIPCTKVPTAATMAVTGGSGPCATTMHGLSATISTIILGSSYGLTFADPTSGDRTVRLDCSGSVWTATKTFTDLCQGGLSAVVTVIDATHLKITTDFGGALCTDCSGQTIPVEITVTLA